MKFVKTLSNYFLCPICPPHQVWGTGSSAKPISKTGGVIGGGPPTRLWTDHRQRHHQPLTRKTQHKTQTTQKAEEQRKREAVARRWAGVQAFGLGLRPKAWAKTRARQGRAKNFKNHLRKYP